MNSTLFFLTEYVRSYVLDEKIFVVPSFQIGHQIGESLAREAQSWVNLRFMTLAALAQDVAGLEISRRKLRGSTGSVSLFVVERIFRELQDEGKFEYFGELEVSSGLIRAFLRSVLDLRLAGMKSGDLDATQFINAKKGREIILILQRYEEDLARLGLIDKAGVYEVAIEELEKKGVDESVHYLCFPDHPLAGLERAFLDKLAGDRLVFVPQGPVYGLPRPQRLWNAEKGHIKKGQVTFSKKELEAFSDEDRKSGPSLASDVEPTSDVERMAWVFAPGEAAPPLKDKTIDIFRAVGPTNECREILRRLLGGKTALDEVEVIYPPGSAYPSIFYVLSAKARLKVTYAEGVPLSFTAPGRAFHGIVNWMERDFLTMDLCRMIEGNTLILSRKKGEDRPSPVKTSRYLRSAMIGWGRNRYIDRLRSLRQSIGNRMKLPEDEERDKDLAKMEESIQDLRWLEKVMQQILAFFPEEDGEGLLDLGELCAGVSGFLRKFVSVRNDLDGEALGILTGKLEEASQVADSKVPLREALSWLRSLGEGLSVGASSPLPGHIHLSSYNGGGYSGRPVSFIAGLDQGTFPGSGRQDPILLDEEREAVSSDLLISSEALRERLYDMARLLSSLRGKVVFSYSAYDTIEDRPSFPSSLLLQVRRLMEGDPGLDYSALADSLPEPSGFLPEKWDKVLDEIDWWLSRLIYDGRLRDGRESIHKNFPHLDRGVKALESRREQLLTCFDGVVDVASNEFNPVENRDIVMSASRLEQLAKCPYGYFLNYVLGIRKPDEIEYDQSRWLDALQRGSLLHSVFCTFMREMRKRNDAVDPEKHLPVIEGIAEEIVAKTREEIPPPSEGIFEREKRELMEALKIFLRAEKDREVDVSPVLFEAFFGMSEEVSMGEEGGVSEEEGEGMKEPAEIPLTPDRTFKIRGRIDRIDRISENLYRIIDYKTGIVSSPYETLDYFGRGKILQHALYSLAAEQIIAKLGLEDHPEVVESGYYFPTRRGEGREVLVRRFDRQLLQELLWALIDVLSEGNFIVNPDASCDYCDYKPVCPAEAPKKAKSKKDADETAFSIFERLKEYE
ncbi:PD-(D/E)XK nuclease family protein [Acidobacteriota bacterium]